MCILNACIMLLVIDGVTKHLLLQLGQLRHRQEGEGWNWMCGSTERFRHQQSQDGGWESLLGLYYLGHLIISPFILRNCSFQILKARWELKRYHRCLRALQTVLKEDGSNFHSEVFDLPRGVIQDWAAVTKVIWFNCRFTYHSFIANDLKRHPTQKMPLEFPTFDCLWKLFTFLFLYLYLKTHKFHRHPGQNT